MTRPTPSDKADKADQTGNKDNPPPAGKAAEALQAGSAELAKIESQRTNTSSGSLQDRRRLAAGQESSIEISHAGVVASRHTRLNEKDLVRLEKNPLADFIQAAAHRAMDPKQYEKYWQGQLEKIIGIGEGLNQAKEETKSAAVSGWKALTDGSVAAFLAQPDALNAPLTKAVHSVLETMAADPNAVNHILQHVGEEIIASNDRYKAMSPREKGRFIGEVMFTMINPEGSAKDGEAALKLADRVATHVDAGVMKTIEHSYNAMKNMESVSPQLGKKARDLLSDYIKSQGLSGPQLAYCGIPQELAGDLLRTQMADDVILQMVGRGKDNDAIEWPVLKLRQSADVVKQLYQDSCVLACGEMLTEGRFTQEELIAALGRPADIEELGRHLGAGWRGGFINIEGASAAEKLHTIMKLPGSFAVELLPPVKSKIAFAHVVVVDGMDEAGNLIIRDPMHGRYQMRQQDFLARWPERAMIKLSGGR